MSADPLPHFACDALGGPVVSPGISAFLSRPLCPHVKSCAADPVQTGARAMLLS